jgi:hypothetical protein
MHCICGHLEREHVLGGRCRVPDCPCEHFQPGQGGSRSDAGGRTAKSTSRDPLLFRVTWKVLRGAHVVAARFAPLSIPIFH